MIRTAPSSMRSCTTVAVSLALRNAIQVLTDTRSARGTSTQPSSCRRRLLSMPRLEEIAEASQGDDGGVAVLELLAQARHVDLDRVRIGGIGHGEKAVRDRLLADGLSKLHHQRLQNGALARRQRQGLVAKREDTRVAVVAQRA